DRAVQVVLIGAIDPHRRDLAEAQGTAACHVHRAVDLRRVAVAAPLGNDRPAVRLRAAGCLVDDHLLPAADLALEPPRRDRLLVLHQAMPALLLPRLGDGGRNRVGRRTRDGLVAKASDAIELGYIEPIEQQTEIRLALAGKADDETRTDGELRADVAPSRDARQRLLL